MSSQRDTVIRNNKILYKRYEGISHLELNVNGTLQSDLQASGHKISSYKPGLHQRDFKARKQYLYLQMIPNDYPNRNVFNRVV